MAEESTYNDEEMMDARMANANSPAHPLPRLIAGLIDMVLLFFIHFGLYSLVLKTPMVNTMNSHREAMQVRQDELKLETGYGEIFYINLEQYESDYSNYHLYQEEDTEKYYIVKNVTLESPEEQASLKKQWESLVQADDRYTDESMAYHLHNYLITAVFLGGIIEAIWFLVIPLIKGCGQTIGMMICGIRMITVTYYGKPKWYHFVGRTLFIYVIESCLPYFFLANWTVIAIPAVEVISILATPRKRAVHDLVSSVMVVKKSDFVDIVEA